MNDSKFDLNKYGLRNTKLIWALIDSLESHHGAIQFSDWVSKVKKTIVSADTASFYRAIQRLRDKGLILEIEPKLYILTFNKEKYKTQIFVSCLSCLKSFKDKDSSLMESYIESISFSKKLSQLSAITLKGICKSCDVEHEH